MHRRDFLTTGAAFGVEFAFAAPALAQPYPSRPIKIIVGFPPGGPSDTVARIVGDGLSVSLGQPATIDNRPGGAGGTTGIKAAASANPDGYTVSVVTPSMAIAPSMYRNVGYDPVSSFTPVAMVARSPDIFVVNAAFPAKSIQELVAYAKANPGKVHFGSPGYGSTPHLIGELFKLQAGIEIVHVPYRGSAPAVTDLLAGQIQMFVEAGPTILPLIEAGKLRAVAVTGETRNPNLLGVQTMIESGFPGFVVYFWIGMVAPAGMPETVVSKLNAVINDGLRSPQMQASLAKIGLEPAIGTPREFAAVIASETQRWAAVVKEAGIKVD
jgi:tripartite-type tricarboxylate transporter receptor subunit TctC